jgi:RimJ/RimL family protein N-acetyltransferase
LPTWFSLVVELRDEAKVVGDVNMYLTNKEERQVAVGYFLGCRYQGQGIATEAVTALITFGFESMGLHRVSARTGNFNAPSWRLMERVGMRREAHFRKSHRVQGQWDDEYVYAVLAEEWGGDWDTVPGLFLRPL